MFCDLRYPMCEGADTLRQPFDVPGGWSTRTWHLSGHAFTLIVPADPNRVLEAHVADILPDDCGAASRPDPYWASVWPAAPLTAEAVLSHPWPQALNVLELGCGVGLVGLAALARGLRVTFSDHEPAAIRLALENARRNGFPHARALMFDWRQPPPRQFDLILASDVLYQADSHQALLAAIRSLLAPAGVCWIGDPGRVVARDFLRLAQRQYRVELRDYLGEPIGLPPIGQFQLIVLHP
jgi:ETFB lysine methyltransferase